MSLGSSSSYSSDQNTVHYAKPMPRVSHSANVSVNSDGGGHGRTMHAHFPTVSISVDNSPSSSPTRWAAKPPPYSVVHIQYDQMRHRCRMLDDENQRLMRIQRDVVADSNRRVEMHLNEIRMLKEEAKKLQDHNKELRDLCCFLDDDRQRARRIAREWQKFGSYTSHVMRQEIHSYQQKMSEMEIRSTQMLRANEELRQLCLYLDEQRQALLGQMAEAESEDLGCGGSERSSDSDQLKTEDMSNINDHQEKTLRLISSQMQTSISEKSGTEHKNSEQILNYIQSLESRIRTLEVNNTTGESYWTTGSNIDSDEQTIIERWDNELNSVGSPRHRMPMQQSTTSTMTSSCTTYASSETDVETAVYVMGDEIDAIGNLEVRTLAKIDEEKENEEDRRHGEDENEENCLPPPCGPLSASLLSVSQMSSSKDCDDSTPEPILLRSASESMSSSFKAPLVTRISLSDEPSSNEPKFIRHSLFNIPFRDCQKTQKRPTTAPKPKLNN